MKQLISICILGLLFNTTLHAGTYKWVDQDGNIIYSQHPPPEGRYESIQVKPAPRSATQENKSVQGSNQYLENADKKRKNANKLKSEEQNSAKVRKENCQSAKKQFEFYTVYKRKKGPDGEYQRITDDERDKNLRQAKQAIKDFCE